MLCIIFTCLFSFLVQGIFIPCLQRRDNSPTSHADVATQTSNVLDRSPSPSSVASVEHVSTQTSSVLYEQPSRSQARETKSTRTPSLTAGQRSHSSVKKTVSTNASTHSNGHGLDSQPHTSKRDSVKGLDRKVSRPCGKGSALGKASQSRIREQTSRKISAMVDPYPVPKPVAPSEVTTGSDQSLGLGFLYPPRPSSSQFVSSAAPAVSTQPEVVAAASDYSSAYSEASSSGTRTPGSSPSSQEGEESLQLAQKRADDERILDQEEEALHNRLEVEINLYGKVTT